VTCLLDYPDQGAKLCATVGAKFNEQKCRCVVGR